MILTGTPAWSMGNSWEENLKPTPDNSYYKAVINNVDIPFQAMQWLGIPISLQWGFEGNVRPFKYTFMENN
jgi:hypothetical protein